MNEGWMRRIHLCDPRPLLEIGVEVLVAVLQRIAMSGSFARSLFAGIRVKDRIPQVIRRKKEQRRNEKKAERVPPGTRAWPVSGEGMSNMNKVIWK